MAAILLLAGALDAQREPHVGYVFPAGGRRGTSVDVVVAGQSLNGVAAAIVSGRGVRAEVKSYERPLNQREVDAFREKAGELQRRRAAALAPARSGQNAEPRPAWTEADEKELVTIRTRLANRTRREATPAIAEVVQLGVTIDADAEPGRHELRLCTPACGTNPLVFCVGDLPETSEASETIAAANPRAVLRDGPARTEVETRLTLPIVANGQILPGDADRFRFAARQGQHLVVAASARALVLYLADAVPGWFQAIVTLRDAAGKELACVDDWRFDPDPVLLYRIPADGDYVVEVRDALYRGREDFVYRLAVGELPFLTGVFPLGGRASQPTPVAVQGWNLPVRELTVPAATSVEPAELTMHVAELPERTLPFARDTLDECLEVEPNEAPASAQQVALPCIVNGRIGRPGDADVYRFAGRAGQQVVAEVRARRLQSPVDSVLRLTDAAGKQIAFNDDREDRASGLTTHHADSWLLATLPADGDYFLRVHDAQRQGGEGHAYRLRLGPPRPDFELRVVPSCINVRAGATIPVTVHAVRADGFAGEIALDLRDAPPGFVLSGNRVPAGVDRVRFTLTVPAAQRQGPPLRLRLEGRARIGAREVVHQAMGCEDAMQAFLYRHLVPANDLLVAVSGRGGAAPRLESFRRVTIPAGGSAKVRVTAPRSGASEQVLLELDEPPDGIAIERIVAEPGTLTIVLRADGERARPGTAGNLIVRAVASAAPPAPVAGGARPPARRRVLGFLPAIPFLVEATGDNHGQH